MGNIGSLVSIIIPYKEDRGYLTHALNSIYRQTYPNIEVIQIKSNNSLGVNFNKGLEKAKGTFIKILPDDDMLTDDAIEILVNSIYHHDFIHSNAYNFFPDGLYIEHIPRNKRPTLQDLVNYNSIHGGTTLYRKSALIEVLGMREELTMAEEYDLHLRMLEIGCSLTYVNEFTFKYRRHNESKSITMQNREKIIYETILRKYSHLLKES